MSTRIPYHLIGAALVVSILACASPVALTEEAPTPTIRNLPTLTPSVVTPAPAAEESTSLSVPLSVDLVKLYEQVNPGIVNILVFDNEGINLQSGQGSGFVIDRQGHIVTNQHVVAGATEIEVDFPSGLKSWAELVGTDLDSDLAVIRVDVPEGELNPLPLGDSDSLKVGQRVVAIGNPFGLSGTMTIGIVSALGRTLDSERGAPGGGFFTSGDIIQTDAAINPGNSGGPLLNLRGEVVGVNRAIRTESSAAGSPVNSGIGFAVPVNIVRRVVPFLIEQGEYSYSYIGISSLSVDAWNLRTLEQLGLPADSVGAYVSCVAPGGPAEAAGIQGAGPCDAISNVQPGGDLVVAINGAPVLEFGDLLSYLISNTTPGEEITVTVLRDGERLDFQVTLTSRP